MVRTSPLPVKVNGVISDSGNLLMLLDTNPWAQVPGDVCRIPLEPSKHLPALKRILRNVILRMEVTSLPDGVAAPTRGGVLLGVYPVKLIGVESVGNCAMAVLEFQGDYAGREDFLLPLSLHDVDMVAHHVGDKASLSIEAPADGKPR